MEYLWQFGHIRGFNYTPSSARNDIEFWRDYDEALVERELDYARRLGLNSARVFLAYIVYEHEPRAFLQRVQHFLRAAHARGISTMVVTWDSCFSEIQPTYDADNEDWIPNPGTERLSSEFWPAGERYCQDLVQTLGPEPGLLLWDVMNEPLVTSYVHPDASNREQRIERIWAFARHFCEVMKELDRQHPCTVGVSRPQNLPPIADWVDVLSFHDYSPNRATIRAQFEEACRIAAQQQKQLLVSEIGCLARANPYDVTLEICWEMGLGWYMWELMIGSSRWRDIHGICYPDGTVRDPGIVAAVQGFFRKRSGEIIPPNVDREGAATRVLSQISNWLETPGDRPHERGLMLLEQMANLLETGELVPMCEPPSVRVAALSKDTPENLAEIRRLLEAWGHILDGARARG